MQTEVIFILEDDKELLWDDEVDNEALGNLGPSYPGRSCIQENNVWQKPYCRRPGAFESWKKKQKRKRGEREEG